MEDRAARPAHMWVEKRMKVIFTLFMLQFLRVIRKHLLRKMI